MTGQQLRNAILQEAIQGHLVPNVLQPGEKTGAELLQGIRAERQKKENEEKGKKAKKLTLSIVEEEPWELPEGWCWCKLKDIIDFTSSGTLKNGAIASNSWLLDLEDIEKDTGRLIQKKRFGDTKSLSDKRAFKAGNVLYSKLRPYLNKCIIAEEDGVCTTEILAFDFGPIYNRYAQSFLMSPYFVGRVNQGAAGVKMPRVNNAEANNTCFPIPPLSIQKAIVKKIEELFPLVDEYDKAARELETLNKILPDKLRKSVLQEAIHGNLVPNDIPDGEATAPELLQQILKERQEKENKEKGKKAKKLTLSTIEEEPWNLPEGWCWCMLGDVFEMQAGKNITASEIHDTKSDDYPYPCFGGNGVRGYVKNYNTIGIHTIVGRQGALCGNVKYAEGPFYATEHAVVVSMDYCDVMWSYHFLIACDLNQYATKTAQPGLSVAKVLDTYFPLPPLSVQHRIVEKIEEVFAAINTLKSQSEINND